MGKLIRIFQDNKSGEYSSGKNLWDRRKEHPTNLAFDEQTKIIYYYFEVHNSYLQINESCMSPYLSENGKFCRFIDNEIVEIG